MEAVRQTEKKYCSRAMTVSIFVAFFFILAGQKPMGKGLILGMLFSVVNFVLMGETLPMRVGKPKNKTFFLSLGSIFARYCLIAIPLILAIKMEKFDIFAVIVGIFSVQLMIFSDHFFNFVLTRRKKN
ncbi:ATP synthase subunit I [Desulfonema magnum]|uniref:ATP synthase domain-containing protein n=1 Tax=Desulfonema magnum TaxID=45655 RepID=A0A975GSK0_9BACT|nr:ATP synthase subunit I [Desulfonema magnum]QTA91992.1 ATP synthase domain-containing protein [Desulfonema magnum]